MSYISRSTNQPAYLSATKRLARTATNPIRTQRKPSEQSQISDNLMEELVTQEVENQIQKLPDRMAKLVKADDVKVYALNRLPALYANSKRGRLYQQHQVVPTLSQDITTVVRQGIAAVQQDPLRATGDLQKPKVGDDLTEMLESLKETMKCDDLSVENVAAFVKYRIAQTARGELEWMTGDAFNWEGHPLYCND